MFDKKLQEIDIDNHKGDFRRFRQIDAYRRDVAPQLKSVYLIETEYNPIDNEFNILVRAILDDAIKSTCKNKINDFFKGLAWFLAKNNLIVDLIEIPIEIEPYIDNFKINSEFNDLIILLNSRDKARRVRKEITKYFMEYYND